MIDHPESCPLDDKTLNEDAEMKKSITQPNTRVLRGEGEEDVVTLTPDELNAKIAEATQAAVEENTKGLKTKNQELLDKLNKQAESLKQFDGVDLEEIQTYRKMVAESEDAKDIKDGKLDEVINRRVQRQVGDVEKTIKQLTEERDTYKSSVSEYESRYKKKVIGDALRDAAIKSGVRAEAIDDVLIRGENIFSVTEDEKVEAIDKEGNLVKIDGEILTPELYMSKLKKDKPHYWPASKGSGSNGADDETTGNDLDQKISAAATSGNVSEYRRLRRKQMGLDK